MSEQESERWALTLRAANSPARVQLAGRQLAIAAQLKQDIDRKRLVALLKRVSYEEIVLFLTIRQALDGNLIARFADHWCWWDLSENTTLPWSLDLIERFADRWNWLGLSSNTALPWSIELIERFEDRWDWGSLSCNTALPWSLDLIERFEDRWYWTCLTERSCDDPLWEGLCFIQNLSLPLLRPADIVEIMAHHGLDDESGPTTQFMADQTPDAGYASASGGGAISEKTHQKPTTTSKKMSLLEKLQLRNPEVIAVEEDEIPMGGPPAPPPKPGQMALFREHRDSSTLSSSTIPTPQKK